MPSDEEYVPSVHLSVNDILVDDAKHPSVLCIRIKQSKTDPFRKGVDLFVGKTGSGLCPVTDYAWLPLCERDEERSTVYF